MISEMKCEYPGCSNEKEDKHYRYCKECWWSQDPRNIKNGGTVDLEKYKMEEKKDTCNKATECYKGREIHPPFSLNNRFIVRAYKEDRGLKAEVKNGFALVAQKVSLKGLELLADVDISTNGQLTQRARKGDLVYIKEGALQSSAWAKACFTSDAIEGEFMIVDIAHVEFVVPK